MTRLQPESGASRTCTGCNLVKWELTHSLNTILMPPLGTYCCSMSFAKNAFHSRTITVSHTQLKEEHEELP